MLSRLENRTIIAKRISSLIERDDVVNLGVGIPLEVLSFLSNDIIVHTEGGALGIVAGGLNQEAIDAGNNFVSIRSGGCFFDSATSFAIIRRGLIDVAVIGANQVDRNGNVANLSTIDRTFGPGGAIDLMQNAKKIIVGMTHTTKSGVPKIVDNCNFPVTLNLRKKGFFVVTETIALEYKGGCFYEIKILL